MDLFPVYPLFDIEISHAQGCHLWDKQGQRYLDLYGGHAVISIGHSHPHYQKKLQDQLQKISFYSNSVQIPLQKELAHKLGQLCSYPEYQLFLCNSGAEANENAFKTASFYTNKSKIIVFEKAFHGRTSLAVAATDSPKILAPINHSDKIVRLPWNDIAALEKNFTDEIAAVVLEGIQGIAGIHLPEASFLAKIKELAQKNKTLVILDEIQSGYGRSGKFFAHQHFEIRPDLITVAKGMGNGFPIGGVLIHPKIKAEHGMLGTTFGGNHLACAAGLAVLEVIEEEDLFAQATEKGTYLKDKLSCLPFVKEVRGKGLMIGADLNVPAAPIRKKLLSEKHIFTGSSSQAETLRLLPPLNISKEDLDTFLSALKEVCGS